MRILHLITRFIRGGAQENTLLTLREQSRAHTLGLVTGLTHGAEGSLIPDVQKLKLDLIEEPTLIRALSPYNDWRAYWRLRQIIRVWRPDLVHTHSSKAGILGRLAARAEKVSRIVHTIHGLPFHPYQARYLNYAYIAAEKFAARHCDKIISVAEAMTAQAVAAKIAPPEKFVTIYSGMDVENFLIRDNAEIAAARARFGIAPKDLVIGKIARLFELKGHDYLIDAFAELTREFPQVRLMFVGDGAERERLQQRCAPFARQVIWTGLLDAETVPTAIKAMDVVAHCSLREGLARVIPQALLAGKPVVTFDVDGAREIIERVNPTWLIPPHNIEKLTSTLRAVLNDLSTARATSEKFGKEFCRQNFTAIAMNEKIMEIYHALKS